MIQKIECEIIICDQCGGNYENYNGFSIFYDSSSANPEDDGWHVDDNTHYCPECHEIDDEDNLIVKPKTAPAPDNR